MPSCLSLRCRDLKEGAATRCRLKDYTRRAPRSAGRHGGGAEERHMRSQAWPKTECWMQQRTTIIPERREGRRSTANTSALMAPCNAFGSMHPFKQPALAAAIPHLMFSYCSATRPMALQPPVRLIDSFKPSFWPSQLQRD